MHTLYCGLANYIACFIAHATIPSFIKSSPIYIQSYFIFVICIMQYSSSSYACDFKINLKITGTMTNCGQSCVLCITQTDTACGSSRRFYFNLEKNKHDYPATNLYQIQTDTSAMLPYITLFFEENVKITWGIFQG